MRYEELATRFGNAILALAEKPENLFNMESYLSEHFKDWLRRDASSPDGLVEELELFAGFTWEEAEG